MRKHIKRGHGIFAQEKKEFTDASEFNDFLKKNYEAQKPPALYFAALKKRLDKSLADMELPVADDRVIFELATPDNWEYIDTDEGQEMVKTGAFGIHIGESYIKNIANVELYSKAWVCAHLSLKLTSLFIKVEAKKFEELAVELFEFGTEFARYENNLRHGDRIAAHVNMENGPKKRDSKKEVYNAINPWVLMGFSETEAARKAVEAGDIIGNPENLRRTYNRAKQVYD